MNDTAKITEKAFGFFLFKIGNTVIFWAVTICVEEHKREEKRTKRNA